MFEKITAENLTKLHKTLSDTFKICCKLQAEINTQKNTYNKIIVEKQR